MRRRRSGREGPSSREGSDVLVAPGWGVCQCAGDRDQFTYRLLRCLFLSGKGSIARSPLPLFISLCGANRAPIGPQKLASVRRSARTEDLAKESTVEIWGTVIW